MWFDLRMKELLNLWTFTYEFTNNVLINSQSLRNWKKMFKKTDGESKQQIREFVGFIIKTNA